MMTDPRPGKGLRGVRGGAWYYRKSAQVPDRFPRESDATRVVTSACLVAILASVTLVTGSARALVAPEESAALEIALPFQQGSVLYGDQAFGAADPRIAQQVDEQIGGRWVVQAWNQRSGTPHYLFGTGAEVAPRLSDRAGAESAASFVVSQNATALGVDTDELRVAEVTEGMGKSSVHFQQTYEGLDVIGGRAHATFLSETGRVFVMGSDFYPIDGLDTRPRIERERAEMIALNGLPQEEPRISHEEGEQTALYVLP
ncbi:MAG: hypothetical protein KC729_13905, partial [Candidatus Eisenbacteria bacterium]|nr:hypothetical protein [Candidatus Eisenbacteria bacterium]